MRLPKLALLVATAVLAGCQTSTTPERREILGSWESTGFPGATVRMTLAETAREVAGAGSWLTLVDAWAFDVEGAVAREEVSLLFVFDTRADINFQGRFEDEDILVGWLTGDGYRRQAIRFERTELTK